MGCRITSVPVLFYEAAVKTAERWMSEMTLALSLLTAFVDVQVSQYVYLDKNIEYGLKMFHRHVCFSLYQCWGNTRGGGC